MVRYVFYVVLGVECCPSIYVFGFSQDLQLQIVGMQFHVSAGINVFFGAEEM